jgi:flagellar M-ring protein FliF
MPTQNTRSILDQMQALFRSIPLKRLILIGSTALAIGLVVFGFAYWRSNSNFRPLYQALSPEDAGTIVGKLKEKGVAYRLSGDGTSVSVPERQLAETRLEMASAGLPKTGRIGFELFDQTKFGATDFMEHINYRRALEGELERTLNAMNEVEQTRVHLTFAKDSVFSESRLPAKGSVALKLRAPISDQNVSAIRYLIASAVEGLSPDSVSVVDMKGNLLGRPREKAADADDSISDTALEYRRNLEKDLLTKLNTTLEPLLGADHFRSSVVADVDFSSGEQSEESYDPTRSVVTSDQRTKETNAVGATSAGVPGTQSNLPRATPRPSANTQVTRETANTSYQTTRTVKRTKTPQGALKRLSVSVLVDETAKWEGRGANLRRVVTPPSQETMDRITEVVSAAAGIVPERGDRLVVQSLPFETTREEPPPEGLKEQAPRLETPFSVQHIVTGILLAAILAAAFFAMRNGKRLKVKVAENTTPLVLPPAPSGPQHPVSVPPTAVTQFAKQLESQRVKDQERQKELEAAGAVLQHLVEGAIEISRTNSELCAGVLRVWLNDKTESSTE